MSIFTALKMMAVHDSSALPVVEQGRVIGILSEHTLIKHILMPQLTGYRMLVRDVMAVCPECITGSESAHEMIEKMDGVNGLYATYAETPLKVRVVSMEDLLREENRELSFDNEQMRDYVLGRMY